MISTIINDRHAGSRVVARITNVLLMTTSSGIRILSGQLMAAAPAQPVHVWIVLLSSIASVVGQGLFTVSTDTSSVSVRWWRTSRTRRERAQHLQTEETLPHRSPLTTVCLVMCNDVCGQIDSKVCLFAAVIVVGASDGFFWATLPIVSNSVFGLKNSGGIYGMLNCFGAIGFISLSLGVQPAVYSRHSAEGMMQCDAGVVCFRGFHAVCLCYSIVGCIAAVGLVHAVTKNHRGLPLSGASSRRV